jgi:hypothetical protein
MDLISAEDKIGRGRSHSNPKRLNPDLLKRADMTISGPHPSMASPHFSHESGASGL